jgi:hypothetical protein
LDAATAGFSTVVLEDVIRAVNANETAKILTELKNFGVGVETVKQWLDKL